MGSEQGEQFGAERMEERFAHPKKATERNHFQFVLRRCGVFGGTEEKRRSHRYHH